MPAIIMGLRRGRRLSLRVAVSVLAAAAGNLPRANAGARDGAPLFAADEPLEITLAMPVRKLVATKADRPKLAGKLSYEDARGRTVSLDVQVSTRGHSRLAVCAFPPLKLNFKRKQTAGTVFAGQDKLKLVTACRRDSRHEDYLRLEYLIYRLYARVTPVSFRVRPVTMRYVETQGRGGPESGPAFFVEDISGVAARTGMRVVKQKRVAAADLDAEQLAVLSLFEYVIGNTDWSALAPDPGDDCCHNAEVVGPSKAQRALVAVPYDFDQAGLIDAEYALPDERLPIKSVRDRLYRGFCSGNDALAAVVGRFDAARPDIETLFRDATLSDRYRKQALKYLADSYSLIDDTGRRQREIVARCRGD